MHILFVDESGSPPEQSKAALQPFFVLGGIVIPEDIWAKMAAYLARLKVHYKINGEIKWRYFAPDKGGKAHALSHLSGVDRESLRTELYQIIGKYKSDDKRFAEQIKNSFRTSPAGKIEGYGLVKFPKGW